MTLDSLIRKRATAKVATAILAIFATQGVGEAGIVAEIATVAVANHTEHVPAPMSDRERNAILAWLDYIGEHDPVAIAEILDKSGAVLDSRRYFLEMSKKVPRANT